MQCPFCKSLDTIFKEKAGQWECNNCEQRFSASTAPLGVSKSDRAEHPRCIFFSYGHDSNLELVNKFKNSLEARGHKVWIDYKEIGTWDDWRGNITRGIHESSMAIAFLSIHSTRDPGVCRNEIAIALQHFGVVYPVLLEKIPEDSVPLNIAHLQWPDLSNWRDIQDGKVPGIDFDRFYEEKLLEIINKVEGDATRFSEEVSLLRKTLVPPTFDGKFGHYLEGFIGREWVFSAFEDWMNNKPNSRVFWLKAGPGFGKTALAVHLTNHYRSAIVGNWFCDHNSTILRNASRAICTISFQLALRWDDFRVRLLNAIGIYRGSSDSSIEEISNNLLQHSASELFDKLIAEPLAGLIWRENKLVIVVDALDEAVDEQGRNDLAALISTKFLELPKWICFFVTSRPDPSVVGYLQKFNPFEIGSSDARNSADLNEYYKASLAPLIKNSGIPSAELEEIHEYLLQNSEGMILYLRMIVDGLKEGSVDPKDLKSLQGGVGGLYASYYAAFEHRFGTHFSADVQPFLRLILAAPGPLSVALASKILGSSASSIQAVRLQLGSYLIDDPKGLIVFHKTLAEWISNSVSGRFYTDPSSGKNEIGRFLWGLYSSREKNQLGLSNVFEDEEYVLSWLPELLPGLPEWKDEVLVSEFASWLWEKCSWSNAELLLNRAIQINSTKFGASDKNTIASMNRLGDFYREKRDFIDAIKQYSAALDVCNKTLDENDPLTIECLKDYGAALSFSEDTIKEAEECLRAALARCLDVFGEKHPTTLAAMHYLASSITDIVEAEDLYRRALTGREETLGKDHPETLMTLNNFGGILHQKGDLDGSIDAYRRAYVRKVDVRGKSHPSTLVSLTNLASTLSQKGELDEAEAFGREVIEGYEANFGADHPLTLEACSSLAAVLLEKKMLDEAEVLYRRVLAGLEAKSGPDDIATLKACHYLADVLDDKGMVDEPEELYRRELVGLERIRGVDHSETLYTCSRLAWILAKKGSLDEAEALYRRRLAGLERDEGLESSSTLYICSRLADVLAQKGSLDEAEALYRRELQGLEKTKGVEHSDTLQSCYNLARVLAQKECFDEAEILYRRELVGLEKGDEQDKVSALQTKTQLADILEQKESYDEAELLYRDVLDAYESSKGPDHPSTLQACYNLASLLARKGNLDDAEVLYRRELAGVEKENGEDHPSTLQTCYSLASVLFKKGNLDEAEILYRRELAGIEKDKGLDHPSTLQTCCNLAEVLMKKGSFDEAESLYRRSLSAYEIQRGATHPHTLDACSRLAAILVREKKIPEAIALLRRYLELDGVKEEDIKNLQYNLACYECLSKNYDEAKTILNKHFSIFPDHIDFALSDSDLSDIKDFVLEIQASAQQ